MGNLDTRSGHQDISDIVCVALYFLCCISFTGTKPDFFRFGYKFDGFKQERATFSNPVSVQAPMSTRGYSLKLRNLFTSLLAITRRLNFEFTTLPYPTQSWKTQLVGAWPCVEQDNTLSTHHPPRSNSKCLAVQLEAFQMVVDLSSSCWTIKRRDERVWWMVNVTQSFHWNSIALDWISRSRILWAEIFRESLTLPNYHLNGIGTNFCSGIKKTTIFHVSLNSETNRDYPLTQIFLKMFKSQHFTKQTSWWKIFWQYSFVPSRVHIW